MAVGLAAMFRALSKFRRLLLAVSAITATSAQAWSAEGHRLVAELAEAQLVSATRAEVTRYVLMYLYTLPTSIEAARTAKST